MINWQEIEFSIAASIGENFTILQSRAVSGGSINSAYVLEGETKHYFVKLNTKQNLAMFTAEAEGLAELSRPGVIRVPLPIATGETSSHAFIVMEYIILSPGGDLSAIELGASLAALHKTHSGYFGWTRDNTIGSTSQVNTTKNTWCEFYREHRLNYQAKLATQNGCARELTKLAEHLCNKLDSFFISYNPSPSLLHGDLWSGNYGYDKAGLPVIFDPAVYFGDREVDIAMTELFGGFPESFYESYNNEYPLDEGYSNRKDLYNLYHVLNHFNIFGGGYQQQAISMMKRLLEI